MIEANVIEAAHRAGVDRLLFLGSSCIYPQARAAADHRGRAADRPARADQRGYAIAKIAGIKLCQAYRKQYGRDYISAMPTNLYGPGDNFDLRDQPCAAGADPQGARGQAARGRQTDDLGQRHAAARIPPRRRLRRRARPHAEGLFGDRSTSMSARARI